MSTKANIELYYDIFLKLGNRIENMGIQLVPVQDWNKQLFIWLKRWLSQPFRSRDETYGPLSDTTFAINLCAYVTKKFAPINFTIHHLSNSAELLPLTRYPVHLILLLALRRLSQYSLKRPPVAPQYSLRHKLLSNKYLLFLL